ncbi:hypothetical protein ACOR62_07460 [Neisseria lisongii]|uniref:Uncharacterized protein n=1 Tax=Neisseria lisongii TaxID=2912188 RepID=A0AAW5AP42_9NEIS|nr:hypothetical protein [Neisseria lisongii]MCF7530211.1 hypothetical protein [Neisseria lisongii]
MAHFKHKPSENEEAGFCEAKTGAGYGLSNINSPLPLAPFRQRDGE